MEVRVQVATKCPTFKFEHVRRILNAQNPGELNDVGYVVLQTTAVSQTGIVVKR